MKKKENWIKKLLWVTLIISLIVQANILLDVGVHVVIAKYKQNKIEQQKMICPPDICTLAKEPTSTQQTVEFEEIELPPLPPIPQIK